MRLTEVRAAASRHKWRLMAQVTDRDQKAERKPGLMEFICAAVHVHCIVWPNNASVEGVQHGWCCASRIKSHFRAPLSS